MSYIKQFYNTSKKSLPGVFRGIKKTLAITRNVISISKDINDRFDNKNLNNLLKNRTFKQIDRYTDVANQILNKQPENSNILLNRNLQNNEANIVITPSLDIHDKINNISKILTHPRNNRMFFQNKGINRQVISNTEEQNAIRIVENMSM
jgi:uncharacterized membrane protein YgaE (UPF0421/DUF939 family)